MMLEVDRLTVEFAVRGRGLFGDRAQLKAVDDVSFSIARGETLGLVGESGCGKTTLMRTILGLQAATSGTLHLDGQKLGRMARHVRQRLQMVFQDPASCLNPRMTIHDIVAEPLRINRCYSEARVRELLGFVGMTPEIYGRLPAAFSGGQRQRIGIARALALAPEMLVLDEPVSALDVSIQAQVINLLIGLQAELKLTYLFVAHDISVVGFMSDRIAVMYRGRIVEIGPAERLLGAPLHPYTQQLLTASPALHGFARTIEESPPDDLPVVATSTQGCAFLQRCPQAQPDCARVKPMLSPLRPGGHEAACWHPLTPLDNARQGLGASTA